MGEAAAREMVVVARLAAGAMVVMPTTAPIVGRGPRPKISRDSRSYAPGDGTVLGIRMVRAAVRTETPALPDNEGDRLLPGGGRIP
jgi:hypothetical protein